MILFCVEPDINWWTATYFCEKDIEYMKKKFLRHLRTDLWRKNICNSEALMNLVKISHVRIKLGLQYSIVQHRLHLCTLHTLLLNSSWFYLHIYLWDADRRLSFGHVLADIYLTIHFVSLTRLIIDITCNPFLFLWSCVIKLADKTCKSLCVSNMVVHDYTNVLLIGKDVHLLITP